MACAGVYKNVRVRSTVFFVALLLSAAGAAACGHPEIVAGARPAVVCVYGVLKSDPDVQSIQVFRVDNFRSAIEYTFHDERGKMTADILFSTIGSRTTYDLPLFHEQTNRDAKLLRNLKINSKCAVTSAFDDLEPTPKPRNAWQQVEWPPRSS